MTTFDSVIQFICVSILFIFVLLASRFTAKFVANAKLEKQKFSNFKVVETFQVTQNKYLQLIQVGKKYFVISVCKDTINLITEINESDIEVKEASSKQIVNFSDIIEKLKTKQQNKKTDEQFNHPFDKTKDIEH